MKILCAGPTSISKSVMEAMGVSKTNPDLDPEYKKFHGEVLKKFSEFIGTEEESFFLLGEAMIGLEAAICNLTEPCDRVLIIENGFFGKSFSEMVEFYNAKYEIFTGDYRRGIDIGELEEFLKADSNFKYATIVHCETPSGITNDIESICKLLNRYGILSVVDSVSGIGGEEFKFDEYKVDVAICGSQKCFSAPVGITTLTFSKLAMDAIKNRKSPVPSYYMDIKNYQNPDYLPYTFSENLVYAFDRAMDELIAKDPLKLHSKYAQNTREIFKEAGFELYPKDSFSNTLSCILMPEGTEAEEVLAKMREKGIAISKGLGDMEEKVIRIGHMGHNIDRENFLELYEKLDETFSELGINTKCSLKESFLKSNI